MRKNLTIGVLRETKDGEHRTPLTPGDIRWLKNKGVDVEVEWAPDRVFSNRQYEKAGARVVRRFRRAKLLLGIKEPEPADLYPGSIYLVFSHTIKGQSQNMPLLQACLDRDVTLVDYEKITDSDNNRLVYFGRFAGICGAITALAYAGKKYAARRIENPFSLIRPAHEYGSLMQAMKDLRMTAGLIRENGLPKKLTPFIIGIIGHGRVSQGVQEVMRTLGPVEIHPRDMLSFYRHRKSAEGNIFQTVFLREEVFRAKDGSGFYFEKYLSRPREFASNLGKYLPCMNMLFHTSYWDKRYPRLVPRELIHTMYTKSCRLAFIGDLACDVKGSIELTYRTTTREDPVYTYNPGSGRYQDGYDEPGITLLARDNLPSDLPRDASADFSSQIREYVYQIAAHGVTDITNHVAIPREIRRAVITQDGELMTGYGYLRRNL
ncbi:hypothetical protein ACFL5V_04305 [Fibrobacterota bacterium]